MSIHTPILVKGDITARQHRANEAGAICFVDCHFNAASNPNANYCMAIVGTNASNKSREWAADFCKRVGREFQIPLYQPDGVNIGGFNGRGNGNVTATKMPAMLIEPWFVSNPQGAIWARDEGHLERLARCLVDSIREQFPKGGTVALSVGHMYKDSNPNDRGAAILGGGTEAEQAERMVHFAIDMLTAQPINHIQAVAKPRLSVESVEHESRFSFGKPRR